MSGKNINFEDKKSDFYENKKVFKIVETDVDKILVSKREPYPANKSIKYFIGYNDDEVIRPVCIKHPQMTGYVKCFDGNKTMSFKVTEIKTKTKIYRDKVNTNFQGKKVAKENVSCECLSSIMLDSVIKASKKYFPQALLEECKYETKKTITENLINDDLESSSSDSEIECDSESDNE